jgi:chorismate mutase
VRQSALCLFLIVLLPLVAADAAATSDVQLLRKLLIERLALMEQVAAYKWSNDLPIDDPVREANVLKAAVARARAAGLKPEAARLFILAQMEAAKMMQRHYFASWEEQSVGSIDDMPDLVGELRPKIGALSVELVSVVAMSQAQLNTCPAIAVLRPIPPEFSGVPKVWGEAVSGIVENRPNCS